MRPIERYVWQVDFADAHSDFSAINGVYRRGRANTPQGIFQADRASIQLRTLNNITGGPPTISLLTGSIDAATHMSTVYMISPSSSAASQTSPFLATVGVKAYWGHGPGGHDGWVILSEFVTCGVQKAGATAGKAEVILELFAI